MRARSIPRPVPPGDKRSPLDRLIAFFDEQSRKRRGRIFNAIRTGLDDAPNPAPWIAAACTLRDRGRITPDAAIYLVEIFVEAIMQDASQSDPELVATYQRIQAVERAHGLGEDEAWGMDEGPPEWIALQEQWNARAQAIGAGYLRDHGQPDLADLFMNEDEWDRWSALGYYDVWGSESTA